MRALRAQGFAWTDIAGVLGVNPATARRHGRALGVPVGHLSSGTLSGVRIAQGARPEPRRFTRPSSAVRLGKRWRDPEAGADLNIES